MAAVLLVFCLAAETTHAAPASEFYLNLLHRGMSHVDAALYEPAVRELRIAAFGLVNSIPQFETAEIYLAIAQDRLGARDDARRAVQRVLAGERIERHYATLTIPNSTRAAFESIASKVLTAGDLAVLHSPAVATPQPPPQPAPTPPPSPAPPPVSPQPGA